MPDRFVPSSERFRRDDSRAALLPTILFADADEDYRAMARDALLEGRSPSDLRTRHRRPGPARLPAPPRPRTWTRSPRRAPALIVLDLRPARSSAASMPSGRIKSNPDAATHPGGRAHATTTTRGRRRRLRRRRQHRTSPSPSRSSPSCKLMKVFTAYWLETAELPPEREAA